MMSLIARARKLEQLATAVGAWREAKCRTPGPRVCFSCARPENDHAVRHPFRAVAEVCDGDNHLENCPVELARQDMLAAHNALGTL